MRGTGFFLLLILFIAPRLHAQTIEMLTSGTRTSLRGLSVVSDEVIWVSGSNGMVGRSTDGGKTWQWTTVKGFEKREFRDIEAFDAQTAVIIAIAEPAQILKTTDGGLNWKAVFTDHTKGMFLDALDFYDDTHGIVIGDPIKDTVFIATTSNGGDSWERYPGKPVTVKPGEAFFAASGTNILYNEDGSFLAVSGGTQSRLITPTGATEMPLVQGKETTGANSIARFNKNYVVTGGDFSADSSSTANCVLFNIHKTGDFNKPETPPHGYRSCVAYINKKTLITCGTTGVDWSNDGGMNWNLVSKEGFHTCAKAKKGKSVFLAGSNGKVAHFLNMK